MAAFFFMLYHCGYGQTSASKDLIARLVGKDKFSLFSMKLIPDGQPDHFTVQTKKNKVHVSGNSQVALCSGAYFYLRNYCNSIVSWSGNNINIPVKLPGADTTVVSPYQFRYYMNVVTHGYSTPYWDWKRWEKEIDWMALHGINMPLIPGAHEAILNTVFKKIGLTKAEREMYFCGPAHLPWNRMGNINGWDGPLSNNFFKKQLQLNRQVINRMKQLGMHPIVPVFAGFVPKSINRLYPEEELLELKWGGFNKRNHGWLLAPGSGLFNKIGRMFIEEWEKEFEKAEYYLADCFNEMMPPLSADSAKALVELSEYGKAVYNSIKDANPSATWVMQGWTFPYPYNGGNENSAWHPEQLKALLSKVPDDKVMILDVTNEYTRLWWKTEAAWKMYDGFFGKKWVYAFIPVMGGHVPYNGRLDMYAAMPVEALQYENKKNLAGFGFAPEGIENNDIVFELLSDMGWRNEAVELDAWVRQYCKSRYGSCPDKIMAAFDFLRKSVYGNFTDDAIFQYQFGPLSKRKASVNTSPDFARGVKAFIECSDELQKSKLYQYDLIELTAQYLGLKADELLLKFKNETGGNDEKLLNEALQLLRDIDRLYESHPTHKLQNWIEFAGNWGTTATEKKHFISNAKRLITTWGGDTHEIADYSARAWSGLIRDYYLSRWRLYYEAKRNNKAFDMGRWEENWIQAARLSHAAPFPNPVKAAHNLFIKYWSDINQN